MPRVRVLLFDMDGVLVDVSRSYRKAIIDTAAHFIGRAPSNGVVQRYKNSGGFNDDWTLTLAIIREAGVQVSLGRVVKEFNRRYRGDDWDGLISAEPPLMTARQLQALGERFDLMGIVTGRPRVEATWTIERFGWGKHFPLVVSRDEVEGRGKPDPYPIHRALALLEAAGRPVSPEQTAYVGDQGDDMRAARAAGLWAIGYVPHYLGDDHAEHLTEAGAHAVITDHVRLIAQVESLAAFGDEADSA